MKQIKNFCLDQPLRFRIKNLIVLVDKQKINFVYAHFIMRYFFRCSENDSGLKGIKNHDFYI